MYLWNFRSITAHRIAPECRASSTRYISTQNEAQSMVGGKCRSTTTLHSDQPTHGIAPECRVHNPGIKNNQNELHWYLTAECGDLIF